MFVQDLHTFSFQWKLFFPLFIYFFKKRNAKYDDVCAHLQSVQWREYSCGKQCSDVLHIDESSWNTAPVFKTVGNWACIAFIAFCGNMMYLFWKVRQFIGDFFFLFSWRILFKWSRWRQQDPPAIESDISAGGVRIAEGKKKMIIATMRMMVVMMVMVIMAYHRFSGASECLLGVCLRLRSCFHAIFSLSLSHNCALLLHFFLCIFITLFPCLALRPYFALLF